MIAELVSPFSPLTCPPPPLLPLYVNRSPETRLSLSLSDPTDKGAGEKAAREISPNFPLRLRISNRGGHLVMTTEFLFHSYLQTSRDNKCDTVQTT